MTDRARIREVGPRDGLQMAHRILPTAQKLDWCRAAAAAGIAEIEVTSFVPPKVLPQFADAEDVARGAVAMGGFTPAALVPNLRGAERAFALGLPVVNFVLSASEAHNQANVRRTVAESQAAFRQIAEARPEGVHLGGCIATAFGCTIQGAVDPGQVLRIAADYAAMGATEIVVADTVGYGDPAAVRRLMTAVVAEVAPLPVACHFHDTRGLGLANVVAALEAGVRAFDASLAGLGGCPFAPGATGNICTEDTVYLLESMGIATGIDIEALLDLRTRLRDWLPDDPFSGAIARAGLPKLWKERSSA